jgi:hypothetical protein
MSLARARWYLVPGWRRKASLLRATLAPDDRWTPWALARRLHALRVHRHAGCLRPSASVRTVRRG